MSAPLSVVCSKVSVGMNVALLGELSLKEVRLAVFDLGDLKAPGPDGFPGLFFQHFWPLVGHDVFLLVKDFFDNGHLSAGINHNNIVLIPKDGAPESISQFRPIALCNFVYKIISKVLANRLKVFLGSIVSPHQSAFIPHRLIQDGIFIANEVFHHLRGKKRGRIPDMAIKTDISKAYDRVE